MVSAGRIIELLCAYAFLFSLIENMFPFIEEFYKKLIIGIVIRIIQFILQIALDDFIWNYDCNLNFGCDQYNSVIMFLYPYKSVIQLIAGYATDILNFLTQRSETIDIKNEIATAKKERADAKKERAEMNLRIDGNYEHLITIPDDYIFKHPANETRILPQIDIQNEFNILSNVAHHHQD